MKYYFIILIAISFSTFAQSTNPEPYCAPPQNNSSLYNKGGILNVKINTLNNSTGLNTVAPQYSYYDSIPATNIYRGHQNIISVTFDSISKNGDASFIDNSYYSVWIDYNNDSQFEHGFNGDYSEIVMSDTTTSFDKYTSSDGSKTTISTSFFVPDSGYIGVTRMRVSRTNRCQAITGRVNYLWQCDCGYVGNIGETEDYNVNMAYGTPPITGVQNISSTDISLYPNPTTGILHIKGASTPVFIYNIIGNQVYTGSDSDINISQFPAGIYLAKIDNSVYRIIKQ